MAKGEEIGNKQVLLKDYVLGFPKETDMVFNSGIITLKAPGGSEAIVVKNLYLSCNCFIPSFVPGSVTFGDGAANVVDSNHPNLKEGGCGVPNWMEGV